MDRFEAAGSLSTLNTHLSPIKDAHAVAVFIHQLSAAEEVTVLSRFDTFVNPKECKFWEEVSALLPILRRARPQ